MVMASGAWVLFSWFATDWDRQRVGFATGDKGVRIARVLYGAGLIPFGYAHFANIKGTAALVRQTNTTRLRIFDACFNNLEPNCQSLHQDANW
jgi:hypothetical protein